MLFKQFGLVAVSLVQCFAHPTSQTTLNDGSLTHASKQYYYYSSGKLTVDEVLQTVKDLTKIASDIGQAAAALPVPSRDGREDWEKAFVALQSQLKNQTAHALSLRDRLEDGQNRFDLVGSMKVLKAVSTFMLALNETELDPLVQFSRTKLEGQDYYRYAFTDRQSTDAGGFVSWASTVNGALIFYEEFFTSTEEFPEHYERNYYGQIRRTTQALRDTVKSVVAGEWRRPGLEASEDLDSYKLSL